MLANYQSKLSAIRQQEESTYDLIENCNIIHCDIIYSILCKKSDITNNNIDNTNNKDKNENQSDRSNEMKNNVKLHQSIQFFILNKMNYKQIISECHNCTLIHQTSHKR